MPRSAPMRLQRSTRPAPMHAAKVRCLGMLPSLRADFRERANRMMQRRLETERAQIVPARLAEACGNLQAVREIPMQTGTARRSCRAPDSRTPRPQSGRRAAPQAARGAPRCRLAPVRHSMRDRVARRLARARRRGKTQDRVDAMRRHRLTASGSGTNPLMLDYSMTGSPSTVRNGMRWQCQKRRCLRRQPSALADAPSRVRPPAPIAPAAAAWKSSSESYQACALLVAPRPMRHVIEHAQHRPPERAAEMQRRAVDRDERIERHKVSCDIVETRLIIRRHIEYAMPQRGHHSDIGCTSWRKRIERRHRRATATAQAQRAQSSACHRGDAWGCPPTRGPTCSRACGACARSRSRQALTLPGSARR